MQLQLHAAITSREYAQLIGFSTFPLATSFRFNQAAGFVFWPFAISRAKQEGRSSWGSSQLTCPVAENAYKIILFGTQTRLEKNKENPVKFLPFPPFCQHITCKISKDFTFLFPLLHSVLQRPPSVPSHWLLQPLDTFVNPTLFLLFWGNCAPSLTGKHRRMSHQLSDLHDPLDCWGDSRGRRTTQGLVYWYLLLFF